MREQKMNEKEYEIYDKQHYQLGFPSTMGGSSGKVKNSRFENEATFSNYFSKYHVDSGRILHNSSVKYVEHYGGVPVGIYNGNVLIDSSDSHTMVFGSTGSKKSRLLIMPMVRILADAGESMIITDPKSEIYDRTSGYLEKNGYTIKVINLRNPSLGNSWNPLYIPYLYYQNNELDKAYEFANDIAVNLCLAEISDRDPFWDYSSRDLFFGLELLLFRYCFEYKEQKGRPNIANLSRLRQYIFKNHFSSIRSVISDLPSELKQFIDEDLITLSALIGTINAPDKTQASILSTYDEKMRCFTIQPDLLNMLSTDNLNIEKIGDQKTAIFVIMPDEKTSYHKLVSLFIKQSYEVVISLAQKRQNGKMPIRINYILDEFASLPSIKDFPAMISASRSRNIRFTLVVQSKHQLIGKYGDEADVIQSNCSNWIFLTSREIEMLKELSILCGEKRNGKPLVPIDYLQHLNKEKGEALVLIGRLYPYITRLPDIKSYDGDRYEKAVKMPVVSALDNQIDFTQSINDRDLTQTVDSLDNLFNDNSQLESYSEESAENISKDEIDDLQRELERKFDELFGPIDDD